MDDNEIPETLKDIGYFGLDFVPIVGEAKGIYETKQAFDEGDYIGAGIGAAATALGVIPVIGDMAGKALKTLAPSKTQTAYKLFRTKPDAPDEYFPLFVNADQGVAQNQWIPAEVGALTEAGKVKSKIGDLAYRPGWHAGDYASATHIGGKSTPGQKKPDYRPANQVWAEVELPDDVDWQEIANSRASTVKSGPNKGQLNAREAHITDQIPEGGFYRYKTNPNMQGNWLIGGSMKINRRLDADEVKAIGEETGIPDLPSLPELIDEKNLEFSDLTAEARRELRTYYPETFEKMNTPAEMADGGLMAEQSQKLPADMYRADGSIKSEQGFLGPVKNAVSGKTMTELSIGIEINGREMEVPAMVPTLTPEEIEILRSNDFEGRAKDIPESIMRKAKEHAEMRIEQGLDPFYQDGEEEQMQARAEEPAPAPDTVEEEDIRVDIPQMYHGGLMDCGSEMMEMPEPPPGALDEEVADDIPAFLSTGEFVLPADVVRWHGLKHIMEMRDEAKEGLMAMEYEGQIQEVETEEYDGEGAMDSEVSYEDGASEEGVEELLAEIPAPPAEGDILETAVLSVAEMGSEDIEDDYYPSKEGQFSFMPKVSFALIK